MPVILRIKGYRVWFYEADLTEPIHVHVGKEGKQAKYWIDPITLARVSRFRDHELNEIERILQQYKAQIVEVWKREQEKSGSR